MAAAGRYLVFVTNDSTLATNPAVQTHWIGTNGHSVQQGVTAQLIAFTQYQYCAANSRIERIEYSPSPTGGTLPVPFPDTAYSLLQTQDTGVLNVMTDWNVAFGNGDLAVLGSGGVFSKRTTTPGRHGRGRLTTPWLSQNGVTAQGGLKALTLAAMIDGWRCYLQALDVGSRSSTIKDLAPYVNSTSGSHLITAITMTSRLGRLRSRTA